MIYLVNQTSSKTLVRTFLTVSHRYHQTLPFFVSTNQLFKGPPSDSLESLALAPDLFLCFDLFRTEPIVCKTLHLKGVVSRARGVGGPRPEARTTKRIQTIRSVARSSGDSPLELTPV